MLGEMYVIPMWLGSRMLSFSTDSCSSAVEHRSSKVEQSEGTLADVQNLEL